MTLQTQIVALRNLIQETLQSQGLLGKFLLPNQIETPAIVVENKRKNLPEGTIIQGLEVTINVNSEFKSLTNSSHIERVYEIKLLQWDDTKTTLDATELLIPILQSNGYWVKLGLRLLPREAIGNIEQVKIEIREHFSQRFRG